MSIRRVALIYDDQLRPETTGAYCRRALEALVAVQHFRPADLDRVPSSGFDLYLNVDDGLEYRLPPELRPSAWWAIDTHLNFNRCLARAHDFDFLFAAQRDGAFQLRDEGITTTWLPLACDPAVHKRHALPIQYDLCFVGNLFPGPRSDLLHALRQAFPATFIGRCYFEEMAKTYSASRIVFNRSIRNDVNMRVFEALACGSLLMTNALDDNGQAELFQDGVHLATYAGPEELLEKVRYYLRNERIRRRVETAGLTEVLAKHTYRRRMERLLIEVETLLNGTTVGRGEMLAPDASSTPAAASAPFQPTAPRQRTAADQAPLEGYDPSYHSFSRPEVLALIPLEARRILDVGCGAGRLGEALKARQLAQVVGVEVVEAAAHAAQGRIDRVLVGDVERMHLPFTSGEFDAVVCADVVEHLQDPVLLLRRARAWLTPQGRLVASIPNVRHHSVVRGLLDGNWTYEAAGLLDRTHLQFFTRRGIGRLLQDAGFQPIRIEPVPGPGYEEWHSRGRPGEVKVQRLHVKGMTPEEAEEFYVYQYLVEAAPAGAPLSGVVPDADRRQENRPIAGRPNIPRPLRILYLGDFGSSWRHEAQAANALEELGCRVSRFHEYLTLSPEAVVGELRRGGYDCLLFYKGRIAARSNAEVFSPTGAAIEDVLRRSPLPCYTWYVDRALGFAFDPSRESWMRRVAPLCRVAFVAEAELAATDWARWRLLREPISPCNVQKLYVPESRRADVAFIGQLYGSRRQELAPIAAQFPVTMISGAYGHALSAAVLGHKIILGPRFPCTPGYWGNRIYVVLGHGGFFLAPEIPGMAQEGLLAGVHYAPLGDDPVADVRFWLDRPQEREKIARAGQELVLSRFTYERAASELCRVIAATL